MSALAYYLALPVIYAIALLPFPLLYLLSDVVFALLYHVIGYRRDVVRTNLRNSFPEKSESERRAIERDFYRWFCDLVLETVKTLTITPAQLKKRVAIEGEDVVKKYFDADRSIIGVMGHWGNWELGAARAGLTGLHRMFVIYRPLHNKHFDRLVLHMRTRLGNGSYTMQETVKGMMKNKDILTSTGFIADQTPPPDRAYWTTFLNQDTPVFEGPEKIAKKLDQPVIYVGIDRVRRGYYVMRFEDLAPDPRSTGEGGITELHTRRLEEDIRRHPSIWLWTHRRWKHHRPNSKVS